LSNTLLIQSFFNFQKPKIHSGNKTLQAFLDKHLPSLKETYWPCWFSWEGRLQSALGLNLRISRFEKLPYQREILKLKDGGQLGLDFLGEKTDEIGNDESEKLIVLMLPGLTSSSNTSYVKTLAMTIVNSGAIVAVLNNRGIGGVPLTTPRTYCATK
jgi:predicted alpha/beta-fold hydrolase